MKSDGERKKGKMIKIEIVSMCTIVVAFATSKVV